MLDFTNIIAIFLAIWHTVRRLDAARHESDGYPDVEPQRFTEWKRAALRAHAVILWTCFGYTAVDLACKAAQVPAALAGVHRAAPNIFGASLCALALVGIIVGMVQVRRSEKLRVELGIELGRSPES